MDTLLAAARELLGMELAYLSELRDDALVLQDVDGDADAFGGVAGGAKVPRALSWCHAVVDGEAPRLVRDAADDPQAAVHPFVARDRHPRVRGRPGAPARRRPVRHAVLPEPHAAARARRARHGAPRGAARMARPAAGARPRAPARRRAELEATAGQALIAALNARENYTAEHSEAVLALALEVAEEMGLEGADAAEVGQVALLHDIGKVGVPDAILQKRGGLTAPEWEVMREHPVIGARIVSAIASLAHLAPAVRAEHERWDGLGYPDGLAGEEIPLASRICFICDAWHAMTSDRPYRRALTTRRRARSSSATPAASSARDGRGAAAGAGPPRGPAGGGSRSPPPPAQLPQVRPDRPLEAELRALIAVSQAVAAAHRLEEVLEIVREQALPSCAPRASRSAAGSAERRSERWQRRRARRRATGPPADERG